MRMIAGLVVAMLLCVAGLQGRARAEDAISRPALDRPHLALKGHASSCREFEPDDDQFDAVTHMAGSKMHMHWARRLASTCLEIRAGDERVVSLAVNRKSPMVASFTYRPSHHLLMFAALIVDRPVVLGETNLMPGMHGLWLDREGVPPLENPSRTIVIRGEAGDVGRVQLAGGIGYPLPHLHFEPEGEDSVSLNLGQHVRISFRISDR